MQIVKIWRQRKHKVRAGLGILRITSVHHIAGEAYGVTEILASAPAIDAGSVGACNPRDTDARAIWQFVRATLHNLADNLMTWDNAIQDLRQFAFNNVQVGPAHSAGELPQILDRVIPG